MSYETTWKRLTKPQRKIKWLREKRNHLVSQLLTFDPNLSTRKALRCANKKLNINQYLA